MKTPVAYLIAAALAAVAMPASAAVFSFSYTTRSDDPFARPPVSASGMITADLVAGTYNVSNITGVRANVGITGFDLFDTAQTFTLSGNGAVSTADFAFRVNGVGYDVYSQGPGFFSEYPFDPDTFEQTEPNRVLVSLSITPAAAVPEPASWALMIGGMGAIGGIARRRRAIATPA